MRPGREPLHDPEDAARPAGRAAGSRLRREVRRVVSVSDAVLDPILISLLAGGHVLIEGIPGTGKTLLSRTLARCLDCSFHRIQFTNDLMPSDIVGASVWRPNEGVFEFVKGPLFANVVRASTFRASPIRAGSRPRRTERCDTESRAALARRWSTTCHCPPPRRCPRTKRFRPGPDPVVARFCSLPRSSSLEKARELADQLAARLPAGRPQRGVVERFRVRSVSGRGPGGGCRRRGAVPGARTRAGAAGSGPGRRGRPRDCWRARRDRPP